MGKQYRVGCKKLDENGKGVVLFNNRKFSVADFLPGEKGQIELVYKKNETGAKLVSLDQASKDRVKPDCPQFGRCGGCQLQHMSYDAQLRYKQGMIEELFSESCEVLPIIGMGEPHHYRNKCYATFSYGDRGKIISGIYEENSHRVVQTKDCLIQNIQADAIVTTIRKLMKETQTTPYNEDRQSGILRHVYIRIAHSTGEVMVVLVTGKNIFSGRKHLVDALVKHHPQIKTVVHNINDKKTNMVLGDRQEVVYGKGYIEDELCGLRFRISPKSFYQVNPAQTEILYNKAMEFAGLSGNETVLDAYCGIGTIALIAAKQAKHVIGVELNKDAVKDAKGNAALNEIKNTEFFDADASEFLTQLAQNKEQKPDVVILDPPRSGCDEKCLQALLKLAPEKIVYISCNPETQKRDVTILAKKGYRAVKVQAVDMFAETGHVETVVALHRTNS